MLLVGITGGPGSGKSTVSALFRELGAHVLASDDVARQLMKPGNDVFKAIVQAFGAGVIAQDGTLNRSALGKLAFAGGRLHQLEEIIHPAVLAHERSWAQGIAEHHPDAIAMVETAIMFERLLPPGTPRSNPDPEIMQQIAAVLRKRFDRILLVTASEEVKQHRFAQRLLQTNPVLTPQDAADDALRRLALQIPDSIKQPFCDAAIPNDADIASLTKSVQATWNSLQQQS